MAEQEFDLLEIAAVLPTQFRASPAEVNRDTLSDWAVWSIAPQT
jgi:hypothetical protein